MPSIPVRAVSQPASQPERMSGRMNERKKLLLLRWAKRLSDLSSIAYLRIFLLPPWTTFGVVPIDDRILCDEDEEESSMRILTRFHVDICRLVYH
jgi:hypothetical protein